MQWGQKFYETELSAANGLALGSARLSEHLPGLMFTADGEALDLRGDPPTFRNICLRRIVDR